MTLLEVAVALTVAGTALAAGAATLGFLVDQQARTGSGALASSGAVRTALRDWTSSARLTTEGDAEFRGARTNQGRESELSFVTTAPTGVASAEVGTHVRIFVQRADTAAVKGLVAELAPWRRPGVSVIVSLAPDATGFDARFLSSLFGRRSWQESWVSTSVLPAAVELRVHFPENANSPTGRRELLALPLTIALGGRR